MGRWKGERWGVTPWSVSFFKGFPLATAAQMEDIPEYNPAGISYVEGTIANCATIIHSSKDEYTTEAAVQDACNGNSECKGYLLTSKGTYYMLGPGSNTWSAGIGQSV